LHDGTILEGPTIEAETKRGEGKITYTNGSIYEGPWTNNLAHGLGKILYANSDVYQGEFRDGALEGHGTFSDH
jgi:hypothetical protein